jgi:intracellular septation protein
VIDQELASLRHDPSRRRVLEFRAIVHVVRPIASDLLATVCFYAALAISGNVAIATLLGIGLGLAQLIWMLARGQNISPIQWASLSLVLIVGTLSLATGDARYVLYKASLIYLVIGAGMLRPGWLIRYIPPIALDYLARATIVAFGYLWAALILGTGLLNLLLTLTEPAKTVAIVMGIWAPSSKIALLAGQYIVGRSIVRRKIKTALNAVEAKV